MRRARRSEEAPDSGSPDADEHLDERCGRLREERSTGLVCDRLRQERLPGPRGTVEEDPLRHLRAEVPEARRVTEIVDYLAQLLNPRMVTENTVRQGFAADRRGRGSGGRAGA